MKFTRRGFVKKASFIGGATVATSLPDYLERDGEEGQVILLKPSPETRAFKPLETIRVEGGPGILTVRDGRGRIYFKEKLSKSLAFQVGGALGSHIVTLENKSGKAKSTVSFLVDGKTSVGDKQGIYSKLLNTLYWTMTGEWKKEAGIVRYNGKFYYHFVPWLRDHVHTLKGMKYFYPELKTGIDLYADSQREDGMIWDNIYTRDKEKNWWEKRFSYANFILPVENGNYEFHRIPVEADVEYLFVEGLYFTWKATGDDSWMKSRLDNALRAIRYCTSDVYRWSEKFQLVKRGFTIDTWDFQAYEDTLVVGGDIMVIDKDKTRFGIMFGDNTGLAMSCRYLAEMLHHAGRKEEGDKMNDLSKNLKDRVNKLSWNGQFFTHHVPEDPKVVRDLGVDQSEQISLSNAYSLNRDITHEQAVAIIKSYLQIRDKMPASSPAEWYTIFPPFEKGFGVKDSTTKWEYMNGGVTPIVAGELAHGAFEHGFETYGVDILKRVAKLAEETDNYLHCTYRGSLPNKPARNFKTVTIREVANINLPGKDATFDGQWIGHTPANDKVITKLFHEIPFEILNPDSFNNTCLELHDWEGGKAKAVLPVDENARSIYLLHTIRPSKLAGIVNLRYSDGTVFSDYITDNKISNWWRLSNERQCPLVDECKKAWRSNNDKYVAFYVYGLNNPQTDKKIEAIELLGVKQPQKWQVLGVTTSDYPVYFQPDKISHGIPDNWGAAAVVYALIEGLAGVKDKGVGFNKVSLSPRWEAAGEIEADVTIRYEASGGYMSYTYRMSENKSQVDIVFTGNSTFTDVNILLPPNKKVRELLVNNQKVESKLNAVENSRYATFVVEGLGVHNIRVSLS